MGRYSKKRKQEEARIRAEDAKKTFVENILEFSEKQQEELERLERQINRKKILINKKYRVAYDKIQKEEREKQQRVFEKYDRYIEKRQNEIKGDLESIRIPTILPRRLPDQTVKLLARMEWIPIRNFLARSLWT